MVTDAMRRISRAAASRDTSEVEAVITLTMARYDALGDSSAAARESTERGLRAIADFVVALVSGDEHGMKVARVGIEMMLRDPLIVAGMAKVDPVTTAVVQAETFAAIDAAKASVGKA